MYNVSYIYSATGEKVAKKMKDGTYQYYAGSRIYKNDKTLNYLLMEEGMVNKSSGGYVYEYHLKDHLGNVRVTFQPNGNGTTVKQATEYYPFGMNYPQSPIGTNKYLYNGKEKQDDQLSDTYLDWYDYGARMYDTGIGRFHTIDPLAESYFSWTTYNYVGNNPINRIDPNGMEWADPDEAEKLKNAAKDAIAQYKKSIARIDKKIAKASEKGNNDKIKRLELRNARSNTAIVSLYDVISDINYLGDIKGQKFEFDLVNGNGAHNVIMKENGNIGIQYSSTALQLHETTHAAQYMRNPGVFTWSSSGKLAYSGENYGHYFGALFEQQAYQVQYAYNSSSMPNNNLGNPSSIWGVTPNWVLDINQPGATYYQLRNGYETRKTQLNIINQYRRQIFINGL